VGYAALGKRFIKWHFIRRNPGMSTIVALLQARRML
jgi:hypothetical protein